MLVAFESILIMSKKLQTHKVLINWMLLIIGKTSGEKESGCQDCSMVFQNITCNYRGFID